MKRLCMIVLGLCVVPSVRAIPLYSNTTTDTGDTLVYSTGPYTALGDDVDLMSEGIADQALLQFYNNSLTAGTFDVVLRLYQEGSPAVGPQIGGDFIVPGQVTVGMDVINVTVPLGGIQVPQDLVFAVSLQNQTPGLDLGLDLFEPPTVGSSDPTFLIVDQGSGLMQAPSNNEDVFFELDGSPIPEPLTPLLVGSGLAALAIMRRRRRVER